MTPKRFYYAMIGVNILLVLLIVAGVYFGNVLLQSQAKKLTNAKTQTKVIEQQQVSLTQAKKDIEKYTEINNIAKSIVPQDKDQAKTVREINKIAGESGIALKAVSFQSSNLGQAVAPTTKPAEGDKSATPAAPAQPSISQVKAVDGISGVYALEIIVSSADQQPVPYSSFINFLEKLENNRRTAHVAKITVKPADDGRTLSFVLTLNAYVKP